jgi:signal transduction histidine kinase
VFGFEKSERLDMQCFLQRLHPADREPVRQLLVSALLAVAHEMVIEFTDHSVPRAVPEETALCLYRIAQEALHNVVKHSGGTAARVELAMDGGELRLAIVDDGVGFDPETIHANGSLGLVSMSERARFVHGGFPSSHMPTKAQGSKFARPCLSR